MYLEIIKCVINKVKQLAEYMKDRLDNPWDHQVELERIDSCEGLTNRKLET